MPEIRVADHNVGLMMMASERHNENTRRAAGTFIVISAEFGWRIAENGGRRVIPENVIGLVN